MGDYSDEDALIEVQLPDTTQDPLPGRDGSTGFMTDASRLSWSMTEAEMIRLAEKEEQDLIKSSSKLFKHDAKTCLLRTIEIGAKLLNINVYQNMLWCSQN